MKNNKKNIILIIISIILISAIGVACISFYLSSKTAAVNTSDASLIITNLNVGKADCAVLQYAGYTGMIDSGTDDAFDKIDSFLKDSAIESIDFLILTHYDKDHIGSAIQIMESYNVDSIYLADYSSDKEYYSPLMKYLSGRDRVYFVDDITDFNYGKLAVSIYPAADPEALLADEKNADNNMSLVSLCSFEDKNFLFTGDIEKDRITQLLNDNLDLSADWIKTPHHGDYEKNTDDLIEYINPKYAVISTSEDRPAEEKLLNLLSEMDIEYYDTTNGDVVTDCNSTGIIISQK